MQPENANQISHPKWLILLVCLLAVLVLAGIHRISNVELPFATIGQGVDYYADNQGELTFTEVTSLPDHLWMTETDTQLSFGLDSHAYWFRFQLPQSTDNQPRVMEIDYPLLDKLQVWFLVGDQVAASYVTGDALPFRQRPIAHEKFVFDLPSTSEILQVYVASQTAGTLRLPIKVWNKSQFSQFSNQQNLIMGLFFGFLLAVMLSNLFLFVNSGSFTYVSYSGYALFLSLTLATLFGMGYKYLWPDWPWLQAKGLGMFASLTLMFSLLFSVKLIDIKEHSVNLYKAVKYAAIVFAVMALASILISSELHLRLLLPLIALAMLLKFFTGAFLWRKGVVLSRFYTMALSMLLICVLIAGLDNTDIITLASPAHNSLILGATVEAFLLVLALGKRYAQQRELVLKNQYEALMEERQARTEQEQIIRLKEQAQEELEYKVQERTLELEITLRELSETNQELEKMNTTDALTSLRNRRYFDKKYLAEVRRSRREQTELSVVMIDIDHFKSINDKFGHVIGDECIRRVAQVMSQTLKRPSDDACRYGGEEFALILPSTSQVGARQLVESIRTDIESMVVNTAVGEVSFTISAGICTAVIQREEQEKVLLENADNALYEAKNSGRNQTCASFLQEDAAINQEIT